MKVTVTVGESSVEVDLDHFAEVVRDAKDNDPPLKQMIDKEIGALFHSALNAEWLRVSEETKKAYALIGFMR